MRREKLYILSIIIIFMYACDSKEFNKDFDKQKSIELFDEIFKQEDMQRMTCIFEKPNWRVFENSEYFRSSVREELKIKDTSFFNFQIKLLDQFIITDEFDFSKKIIDKEAYQDFLNTGNYRIIKDTTMYNRFDWLIDNNCPHGFINISKPLFNEDYNKAIVHLEFDCGPLCGFEKSIVFVLKNKKWSAEDVMEFDLVIY